MLPFKMADVVVLFRGMTDNGVGVGLAVSERKGSKATSKNVSKITLNSSMNR